MRLVFRKIGLLALASASLGPFAACHALAAPDAPRAVTPTIDLDVEDRGPDRTPHLAHFAMSIVDGKAMLATRDGEAHYEIDMRLSNAPDPSFTIKLRRSEPKNTGDIDLVAAIPPKSGTRVLVAKIDRADGHVTTVAAQVR